jgi:hypothetical protein
VTAVWAAAPTKEDAYKRRIKEDKRRRTNHEEEGAEANRLSATNGATGPAHDDGREYTEDSRSTPLPKVTDF